MIIIKGRPVTSTWKDDKEENGKKERVQGTRKSIEPDYEIWLQTKKR